MDNSASKIDLARLIFTSLNSRDLSELEYYLAESASLDFPGAGCLKGKKRVLAFFKVLFRRYPQLEFTVEEVISEGGRACVLWNNKGQNSKGNPYNNHGITFVKLEQGKIIFISDFFKDTSFVESSKAL